MKTFFSAAAAIIVALGHFIRSFSFINIIFTTFVFNGKAKQSKENEVKWNERKL